MAIQLESFLRPLRLLAAQLGLPHAKDAKVATVAWRRGHPARSTDWIATRVEPRSQ